MSIARRSQPGRSTPDGKWLLTANQTTDTVSLVRIADGSVAAEVGCGSHPSAIVITPDGHRALGEGDRFDGQLCVFELDGEPLHREASVRVGFEPRGIAVSPDNRWAYVGALTAANTVAVVELAIARSRGEDRGVGR